MLNKVFLVVTLTIGLYWSSHADEPDRNDLVVTPEHRQATGLIVHLMHNYHYLNSDLGDDLSQKLLKNFLDALDPNRLIFLEADIAEFYRNSTKFDDYLRVGYLQPAFHLFTIFRERLRERVEVAKSILDTGLNFHIDETYFYRQLESSWPTTQNELTDLWRKRVKNDWLTLQLAGRTPDEIKNTLRKRYEGLQRRTYQLDSNDVYQIFINAYVSSVEPHTSYLSPRTSENFKIRMSLSLEGIGAALQTDNEYTVIRRLIPGGPAYKSGKLAVEDKIIGVGQNTNGAIVDVVSWRLADVVELIRGPKGSVVRLEIIKNDGTTDSKTEIIQLIRNTIQLESQAAQGSVIESGFNGTRLKIGVINLPTFYLDMASLQAGKKDYRSTTRDIKIIIKELLENEIDGLIIDLRGNGGGSLSEATELTGLFIDTGPIVQVRDSSGRVRINRDPNPSIAYTGPLAVLVDRQSASASEIFAGAIQDYGRGIIIGERTYGKGTVQNVVDLNRFAASDIGDLGQLKVTIAQFFRITGSSTQHKGVVPDISFEITPDLGSYGERAIENALPWATIDPTQYQQIETLNYDHVRKQHQRRMKNHPGFIYLSEQAKMRKEFSEKNMVSLLESKRTLERKNRKEASEQILRAYQSSQSGLEQPDDTQPPEFSTDALTEIEADILLNETAAILSDLIDTNLTRDIRELAP